MSVPYSGCEIECTFTVIRATAKDRTEIVHKDITYERLREVAPTLADEEGETAAFRVIETSTGGNIAGPDYVEIASINRVTAFVR